jgi:hypothetical protein
MISLLIDGRTHAPSLVSELGHIDAQLLDSLFFSEITVSHFLMLQ